MTGMTTLLAAAAIAFGLSKALRLPVIPLLMLSGGALRALAEIRAVAVPEALLAEMIQIGLAVLVFAAGADLSPRRMRGGVRAISFVAVAQFFILGTAGAITAWLLGYATTTAVYLGCALSASSTLVVVRHLQERRQMFEPYGRLVLGVLLLQDAFIILILVALNALGEGPGGAALAVLRAAGLGAIAVAAHRWFVPWIAARFRLDDEALMLGPLALLFGFAGVAHLLGLPYLVGAFFAGFTLSAFPMNGLVRSVLRSLSAFFLALFFIGVGANLTIPAPQTLLHSLIFILLLIGVTVPLVTLVAERAGYSTRAAIETAILLSQTSEFSLLIALTGLASGHIAPETFTMVALVTVSTMTLTPLVSREPVAWALMKLHPRYRRGESACGNLADHAVLLGYGRAGPRYRRLFEEHGLQTAVVDDDAAVIRGLIAGGVPCVQGDGSDERTLERAHCRRARVVVCSMRRMRDVEMALDYLANSGTKVFVRVFEPEESEMVRQHGGIPVESAHASAKAFLEWMDQNFPRGSAETETGAETARA